MSMIDRPRDPTGRKARPAARALFLSRPTPEKDETEIRWLMSYSDFMMQLVCLFILLFSVSSVDTSKAVPLAQAWRDEAGVAEVRVPSAPRSPNLPLTSADLRETLREVQIAAGRFEGGGRLRVAAGAEGFRLQFGTEMFGAGEERPNKDGARVADLAAAVLQPLQRRVASMEIVGHASADEAARGEEAALKLSLARAREALLWMARADAPHRLDPATLTASGRGIHEPAADNSESSGRALNRRIEIVVHLTRD